MKMIKNFALAKQNKYADYVIGGIAALLGLIAFFVCVSQGMGNDIWFDEVFSVNFIEHGYGEIAALTAADVHPPMYYWYLKLFHTIGEMIIPGASSIVLCKMASVLPVIGIFVYAVTLIRKNFGVKVMGCFVFFITVMPQILNYTIEIRMYSFALFMITAAFLHGYELVVCGDRKIHWFMFWVYGILTAYTQYYACIAIVAVYISLFVYFLVKKEKKSAGKVCICAILSVIGYLPWLPFFISQVQTVSSSYWIQPLTFRSIFGCIKYVFLPVSFDTTKNYILAVFMIGIVGISYCWSLWRRREAVHCFLLLGGIFVPVFTTFMGFVCSALNRPIFVYRYLVPCLGILWLVAAYVIFDSFSRNWGVLLLIPFLLAGISNMEGFYAEEHKKIVGMEQTQEFLDSFPEDAVVLCNFNHVQALAACYLEENIPICLYGGEPETLIRQLLPACQEFTDTERLLELVTTQDVYFFGSFNSREELLKEWAEDGIVYTEEGTYLLERYYFNVYHLSTE